MHDLNLPSQYTDPLLMLDGGRLAAEGSPNTMLSEEMIAAYYDAGIGVICDRGAMFALSRCEEARWVQ